MSKRMIKYCYAFIKNEVRSSLIGPAFQNFAWDLLDKQKLVTFARAKKEPNKN